MTLKSILFVSFVIAIVMLVGTAFLAAVSNDTATHGQGPLNPRDVDSVRQMAKGAFSALVPVVAGLGILVIALGTALKMVWANRQKEAAE